MYYISLVVMYMIFIMLRNIVVRMKMRKMIAGLFMVSMLGACGGGSSTSSGAAGGGTNGESIDGTYNGVINATAEALGISESASEPFTVTIANQTLSFVGDDPGETFTAPIDGQGNFSGTYTYVDDECTGNITLSGAVNAPNIIGSVDGTGICRIDGTRIDVDITGDFSATRQ